ncbi:glycosyl hydrolase [Opitutaceae bacterium EW11]|nr:glycosyl hydrolase [Opitutaceae bacterium EW11]
MIRIQESITAEDLRDDVARVFSLSAAKIRQLQSEWDPAKGTPVFTVAGRYTSRGWTEWTQGFLFGSAILQYAATGDETALAIGREGTRKHMASHVSHVGVHDHGFNNVSTYGNLYHLALSGALSVDAGELAFYELALRVSGAVQAARWTELPDGLGYIYSFNGPHSLFADTVRSLRSLALAHRLGHVLMGERDRRISLLGRLVAHAETTSRYNVYFGDGRDAYDVRGRVAHESLFNLNDGSYRCPSTQQGYSPFSTWTRGLAWILCGYAEQLEFLRTLADEELTPFGGKQEILRKFANTAIATADFYCDNSPTDGIPYWDTGAPGLCRLGNYLDRPAEPFNDHEPVDSSAAAIAAQGFLRLADHLDAIQATKAGAYYRAAGLTIAQTLFSERYLATSPRHQGLLLHSVYHRPNGWDHIPPGKRIPCGESCLWGDYHLRELALMILRRIEGKPAYTFFGM